MPERPEPPPPAVPPWFGWTLPAGHILFTKVGKELSTIPRVDPVPDYFEYVRDAWIEQRPVATGYRFEEKIVHALG